SRLRFNFGFLLEAGLGTSREIELNYPQIRLADDVTLAFLRGKITATRTSEGIYISGRLHSQYEAECGRCLTPLLLPISFKLDDLFYYPPYMAPAGELVVGEDCFIDLAPLARELSLLEVPIQAVCRPDCKGLCPNCGENLNDGPCGCEQEELDPRLAALQTFLNAHGSD
ncbi:MAG: DUF177 domain-containing protein, partial [Chloroflexota bacterium]